MNTREISSQLIHNWVDDPNNDDNSSINTELNEINEEKLESFDQKLIELLTKAGIYYKNGFDKFIKENLDLAQSYFDIFNIMQLHNQDLLNQDTFKMVAEKPKALQLIFDYIAKAHISNTLNRSIFNVNISQASFITQARAERRFGSSYDLCRNLDAIINGKNNQDELPSPFRQLK